MNLLPFPKRVTAIASLCEGQSIRATARILKSHHNTIMRLGRDVGEGYARLHDELFHGLRSSFIEVDEAWSFVQKKQKRVTRRDPPERGDQYSYIAMDADRVHETLGKTPAMAIGVADHAWTVDELVTECLKRSDRKNPPVRMGSQRYTDIVCKFGICKEATSKAV